MKSILAAIVVFTSLAALVYLLLPALKVADLPVGSTLDYAALLIATSVLASVVFGLVTYVESAVLRDRINRLTDRMNKIHRNCSEDTRRMANLYTEQYYDLALSSFSGMLELTMSMPFPDPETFPCLFRRLQAATIEIHLSRASYLSLFQAIEIAYSLDRLQFLNLEPMIWQRTQVLDAHDKIKIRTVYAQRKAAILKRTDLAKHSIQ